MLDKHFVDEDLTLRQIEGASRESDQRWTIRFSRSKLKRSSSTKKNNSSQPTSTYRLQERDDEINSWEELEEEEEEDHWWTFAWRRTKVHEWNRE